MKIDAKTSIYGIIGFPLGHTLSPAMHNAGFDAAGINAVYLPFPMKNILNIKYSMKQFGIKGLSVTIPHKIHIKRSLDQIDSLAIQVGSVNTILWDKTGLLCGFTTDGAGAVNAIENYGFNMEGKNILVIGSGGSARSIIFSLLAKKPGKLGVVARNIHSTRSIVRGVHSLRKPPQMDVFWYPPEMKPPRIRRKYEYILSDPEHLADYDLIVQTTPLGMSGHSGANQSPLPGVFLKKGQILFDIVYNPQITPFVKLALKKKLDIIPGYKMLLYQGVRQFELFTGIKAPVSAMEKALKAELLKI
ncbi:MAG: shikimate dehydrogenase [Spirochaetia bacterium]|nr:shikimate dehydrogenase [Spirochaetia bacterium]